VVGATIVAIGTRGDGGRPIFGRRHGPNAFLVASAIAAATRAFLVSRLEKPADARLPYWKRSASDERAERGPGERASRRGRKRL
jgi:hypothetical protein